MINYIKNIFSSKKKNGSKKGILRLKEKKEKIVILMISTAFIFELILLPFLAYNFIFKNISNNNDFIINENGKKEILVIDFNEEITTDSYKNIVQILENEKINDDLQEVILIMNSPGGSPSVSEELSHYFLDFSKNHNHINLYIQNIAASGGYYIASVFDEIVSNPNAIVGSIGVIIPKLSFEGLSKKIGITEDPIFAGKYKSPISLFKTADEKTKNYLKTNLLEPTYQVFINHVSKYRNIPIKELIENYAEGKVFAASMPVIQGKLIDRLSNFTSFKMEISNNIIKEFNLKNKNKITQKDLSYRFISLKDFNKSNSFLNKVNIEVNSPQIEELKSKYHF
jgi:protease IV